MESGAEPEALVTEHAAEAYLSETAARRAGIALCLSGGGFRAALFHLGTLRRLNELAVLSQITRLSTVSGGSIVGAHLIAHLAPWPDSGALGAGWEERVGNPFRAFTGRNIRTGPLLRWLAVRWHWPNTTIPVKNLAAEYERELTGMRLTDIPDRPAYMLCATDMEYSAALVSDIIAPIRTDLDLFSTPEAAVLENHGYCLAEAAIREHRPELPSPRAQPFQVPHPEWMDEERVRQALKDSHVRTILGRGWLSAVTAALTP
jgi:hypothetical protein